MSADGKPALTDPRQGEIREEPMGEERERALLDEQKQRNRKALMILVALILILGLPVGLWLMNHFYNPYIAAGAH
ncbi:MAG: hypothetical protein RLY93_04865 [Sumerlaeia bacterium]